MNDARQRRIALNEARLRSRNERTRAQEDGFHDAPSDAVEIMCECALETCDAMLQVTRATYERVRAHDTWFLVAPDHIAPEVERVVEERDGAWIIEKLGKSAEIAEQLA
jgi:hypothetical protein